MNKLKRVLRWWPALLVLILVAGGVAVGSKWIPSSADQTSDLTQTFTAERGNLVAAISPTGEIYAPRQVELSFDVSNIQLIELNVIPGQKVKKGEVLARIDSTTLERAVLQAEADLTVAQDDLEKTLNPYSELDLAQARLSVDQAEITLQEAQETLAETQNPYTELDLIQARLTVSQTEIALQEAEENMATVLNPDTGSAWTAVQDAAAALEIAKNQLIVTENSTENAAKLRTLESEKNWYRDNYWKAQKKFEAGEISKQKLDQEYLNLVAAEEKLLAAQTSADISLTSAQKNVNQAEEALLDAQANLAALQGGPDTLELLQA
ncbi:MAG: biotin/lipoyl-binding protein, partial [Anaerolineae bacterium]|nr:biotin/lipoyl-binding protein [Anaerolineae bacterium]